MEYKPEDYKGTSTFAHLHNHTVFSTLDGVATPEQYAEQCQKRGYPAMSATEHGHMASVPDMYLAFRGTGVKYIAGCEIYFNQWEPERQRLEAAGIKVRSHDWRAQNPEESYRITRNRHLTILCKNQTGFENLVKLTTQAYETGLFGSGRTQFNRIWFEKLCEFKEGLIILSGCLNGPVSHELRYTGLARKTCQGTIKREIKDKKNEYEDVPCGHSYVSPMYVGSDKAFRCLKCGSDQVKEEVLVEHDRKARFKAAVGWVKKFRAVFGDDYKIETQMPGIPQDHMVFQELVQLADHYGIETVLANDCHYLERKDFVLQKIMMATAQDTTINSPDLFHVNSDEQYMKTRAELWARFKNHYSAGLDDTAFEAMCDTTLKISEQCEKFVADTNPKIPEIKDAEQELVKIVTESLRTRGLYNNKREFVIDGQAVTYREQANIELRRFIDKGFASYFLITRDLVRFGKERGWPFSPRGSAGGSLVCFLLDIHVLDPMLWQLSFDRFLSPSRGGYMLNVSMDSKYEVKKAA